MRHEAEFWSVRRGQCIPHQCDSEVLPSSFSGLTPGCARCSLESMTRVFVFQGIIEKKNNTWKRINKGSRIAHLERGLHAHRLVAASVRQAAKEWKLVWHVSRQ